MRVRVAVIFVLLVVPQVAGAGGVVIETKLSRTHYGRDLMEHVGPPETPWDGASWRSVGASGGGR